MAIVLEINGTKYEGFISSKVRHSIDEISNTLQFISTSEVIKDYPIKNNAECAAWIGANKIFTGYIDLIEPQYNNSEHTINIQARSKTSILVDSSVWVKKTFKPPSIFQTVAQKVISDIGLDILVIDRIGTVSPYAKDVSAEPGESIFSFFERLAQKGQFMLVSDGFGNLNMIRTGLIRSETYLLNQKNGEFNNILQASMSYDYSRRFHDYRVIGQASDNGTISNESQSKISGTATDPDAISSKKLELVVDQDITTEQAKKLAQWECNIRRAKSGRYFCTVFGHEKLVGLWGINQLTRVVDDYNNIDSRMLIKSVEYIDSNEGTFTNLELVSPDAYSLEETRPIFEKVVDDIGSDFGWED